MDLMRFNHLYIYIYKPFTIVLTFKHQHMRLKWVDKWCSVRNRPIKTGFQSSSAPAGLALRPKDDQPIWDWVCCILCSSSHQEYQSGWWWLEPWNFEWLSIQLGMSSSQLTNSPTIIFQRGRLKPPTSNKWLLIIQKAGVRNEESKRKRGVVLRQLLMIWVAWA